jgi:hypothetical protein
MQDQDTSELPTYGTEDDVEVQEGDMVYDYYSMKPGKIGKPADIQTGWFDFEHTDGSRLTLNGQRICSLAFAARKNWPGAKDAYREHYDG